MAYYFESKNIKIFPSTNRGNYPINSSALGESNSTDSMLGFDPEAELNTEFNYTHIVGFNGNRRSFVLQWPTQTEQTLKCIIAGYYFEIYDIQTYLTANSLTSNDLYLNVCLGKMTLSNESDYDSKRSTQVLAAWSHIEDEEEKGPALAVLDRWNNNTSKYEFYGLQLTTAIPEPIPNFEIYSLQIQKDNTWYWKNQIFQSLKEGQGLYALQQEGDGSEGAATGDYTVILGPHNREVSSPNAVVIGKYSEKPKESDTSKTEEHFIVGNGSAGNSRHNIFAITTKTETKDGVSKSYSYIQIHGGKLITEDAKFTDKVEFKAAQDAADTSPITLERSIMASNNAQISNIRLTNALITTTPEEDNSPIRLADITIDSDFFESLYNGNGSVTNNSVGG